MPVCLLRLRLLLLHENVLWSLRLAQPIDPSTDRVPSAGEEMYLGICGCMDSDFLWLLGAGLLAPGSADGFTTHGSIARYYLLPLLKKIGHCCILYTLP